MSDATSPASRSSATKAGVTSSAETAMSWSASSHAEAFARQAIDGRQPRIDQRQPEHLLDVFGLQSARREPRDEPLVGIEAAGPGRAPVCSVDRPAQASAPASRARLKDTGSPGCVERAARAFDDLRQVVGDRTSRSCRRG